MNPLRLILLLAAGTLGSEDLTCISAGHLVRLEQMHWSLAILGCFVGIYAGDLALFLAGRMIGRRALAFAPVARHVPRDQMNRLANFFDRHSAAAILSSRFVPGSRLPMYFGAGVLGKKPLAFAGWTFVAALIWTPLVVLLAAVFGATFALPFERLFGHGWLVLAVIVAATFLFLRLPRLLRDEERRAKLIASISKLWWWEFWPMWLFYLPLVPWITWLAVRHRSLRVITAANPAIPHGGIVGESKFDILQQIAGPHVIPSRLIRNIDDLDDAAYPLVLKPDAGQRGAGVRIVRTRERAAAYLAANPRPILAQPLDTGPFEAGVFYYRMPGEARGRIFSITDKLFPIVTGDGASPLRRLILRHPRYRMQWRTFFARHRDQLNRILARDEKFQLAHAGNHCQGTLFCDGSHLITPQLEAAIDEIAQRLPGFHFGRFDVRYRDVDSFTSGCELTVIELNGVTSESTNLYDPRRSIVWAYHTLFCQWSLLFSIAAANRRRGVEVSRASELVGEILRYYRSPRPAALSD